MILVLLITANTYIKTKKKTHQYSLQCKIFISKTHYITSIN